jgi:hypothetical protein
MKRVAYILKLRELGFTDDFIADVLDLRDREREQGIIRRWEDYLPELEPPSITPPNRNS